jgi:tetratricopeptide (TPR) repeat protein
MLKILRNIIGLLFFFVPLAVLAGYEACGMIERIDGGYGPYDYTNPSDVRDKLPVVNLHHFNARVENLIGGFKDESPRPTGDISYVLHAFPNHHRALNAMVRLSWKENTPKPVGSRYNVDCWFDRAIRWRPEDGMVRMIYGNYLSSSRVKRFKEAIPHYELAEQKLKNNPNLFYNMGLLYFNLKDYEKSRDYAHKAYAGGFPLSGLKDMLVKAGKWQG